MSTGTTARKPFTFQLELQGGHDTIVMTGDMVLDDQSAQILRLDSGASVFSVTMPTRPVPIRIVNVGATDSIVLFSSPGVPLGNINSVVAVGRAAWIALDEDAGIWRHMGLEFVTL